MKKFRYLILAVMILGVLAPALVVFADYGLEATAGAAGLKKYDSPPAVLIGNVVGAALSMIGVVFFILMIYGGVTWMFSRGNEEQTKKSLNTVVAACIGLVIILSSYAITKFMLESVESGETPGEDRQGAGVDKRCQSAHAGFQCMEITSCTTDVAVRAAAAAEKRAACEADQTPSTTDKCFTGLCSGGGSNICCQPQ